MSTTLAKVFREYAATEATLTLAGGQWGQAQDTGRIKAMRRDGVTADWFETAARLAGQTSVTGLALIGMAGITGITPNGGTSGGASTAANMLIGIRDSVILKSPYNSTINTIQPTADYIAMTIKGFSAGVQDLLELQTSATTVAWFDNKANLTLNRSDSGNDVSIRVINSDNTNPASNAKIFLSTGGSSAGDPFINFGINSGQQWSQGIDRSDSYKYKISESATLGTSDALIIAPSGAITLNRAVSAGFTLDVTGAVTMGSTLGLTGNLSINTNKFVVTASSGNTKIVGTLEVDGNVGIGQNPTTGSCLVIANSSSPTSGTDQSGAFFDTTVSNASTGSITGLFVRLNTPGSSFTTASVYGIHIGDDAFKGAANTWTTNYGLKIEDKTGGATNYAIYTGAGLVRLGGAVVMVSTLAVTGDLTISRSNVGGNVLATISNTDNTNAASHAKILLQVQGASGGNPYINFLVNGVTNWSLGADNVASGDPFKISQASTLGTTDVLMIDTSGNALFGSSAVTSGQAKLGVAGNIGFGDGSGTAFTSLANGTGATLYKVPFKYWTGTAWETRYLAGISA